MRSSGLTREALISALLIVLGSVPYSSVVAAEVGSYESCLLREVNQPPNSNLTVAEIRRRCETARAESMTAIESSESDAPLTEVEMPPGFRNFFTPYKENFILFGSMENRDGSDPFSGKTLDIRFEFGMKFRMFQNQEDFERLSPLHFGYSQKSWWDIAESSAPFREHNYNPEIFWDFEDSRADKGLLPHEMGQVVDRIGFEHQSNGLDGLASRSWDRIYAQKSFRFPEQNLSVRLKAWDVVNLGVENFDITDYLGNVEAKFTYSPNDSWELSATTLKGHETSKYSYRIDLITTMSYWLNSRFMLSYYDGFGEALISYNEKTRSLRAGIYVPIEF
ncbi:MAG: phospholipase A [Pseudomonadales bacterium]|nr:phospholipase A [Pseudomonadales bacterium]